MLGPKDARDDAKSAVAAVLAWCLKVQQYSMYRDEETKKTQVMLKVWGMEQWCSYQ